MATSPPSPGGQASLVEAARREIEAGTRIVVGLGPQATLRRGYALARDPEGRPLTRRGAACDAPSSPSSSTTGPCRSPSGSPGGGVGR